MTEQIKSTIEEVEWHKVDSTCDIQIDTCDLIIRSLKAWEKVLQELEGHRKNGTNIIGLNDAIDIIKQKLADIEEE